LIIEFERTLIAGLTYDYDNFKSALVKLNGNEFTTAIHKTIFDIMKEFIKTNDGIDEKFFSLLNNEMKMYLMDLSNIMFSGVSVKYYISEIRQQAQERQIKQALNIILYESTDIITDITKLVSEQLQNKDIEDYKDFIGKQVLNFIDEVNKPLDKADRIYTGFYKLDNAIGGLRKKSISMIGARPSTGKTTLALNIIKNQIKNKVKTALFSLEMSQHQIYERYVSDVTNVSYTTINTKMLVDKEKKAIGDNMIKLITAQSLYVFDNVYTIENIIRVIADLKPDFVVIDFIQFVKSMQKFNNRRDEIDHICREIKQAAKIYNCHIMTLSQISRVGKEAPKMSDLKESGALEENHDYVMLLHRPYVLDKTNKDLLPMDSSLMLDKNKYGITGVVNMHFTGDLQRFTEKEVRY